jgi:DNA-binding CsgD family transcriptional regulator
LKQKMIKLLRTLPRNLGLPIGNFIEKYKHMYEVEDNGCWVWLGSICGGGYGKVTINTINHSVHRLFYTEAKGPIPVGYDIDHLCKNIRCVNPDHLEAVTRTVNIRRSSITKLTKEDVEKIRALYKKGNHTQLEIAKMFNINHAYVSNIINRVCWK